MRAKGQRGVGITTKWILMTAGILLVVIGVGCGQDSEGDNNALEDRLKFAESVVGFQITLPTYLPPGTQPSPDMEVSPRSVTFSWYPGGSENSTATSALIRLTQTSDIIEPPAVGSFPPVSEEQISGTLVTFQEGRVTENAVVLFAYWRDSQLSWDAQFEWGADDGETRPTKEMKEEARKVIESILKQRP